MNVDNRTLYSIDEKYRLYGLSLSVTAFEVVVRRRSAVEVSGVDGVVGLIKQFRRESGRSHQMPIGAQPNDIQM